MKVYASRSSFLESQADRVVVLLLTVGSTEDFIDSFGILVAMMPNLRHALAEADRNPHRQVGEEHAHCSLRLPGFGCIRRIDAHRRRERGRESRALPHRQQIFPAMRIRVIDPRSLPIDKLYCEDTANHKSLVVDGGGRAATGCDVWECGLTLIQFFTRLESRGTMAHG